MLAGLFAFLHYHPRLADNRVVLVGASLGGARILLMHTFATEGSALEPTFARYFPDTDLPSWYTDRFTHSIHLTPAWDGSFGGWSPEPSVIDPLEHEYASMRYAYAEHLQLVTGIATPPDWQNFVGSVSLNVDDLLELETTIPSGVDIFVANAELDRYGWFAAHDATSKVDGRVGRGYMRKIASS